jgi:hypothetical protein
VSTDKQRRLLSPSSGHMPFMQSLISDCTDPANQGKILRSSVPIYQSTCRHIPAGLNRNPPRINWIEYTHKRNIEARSRNLCCRGKVMSITYSKCVSVALLNQHARRMRDIILSPMACLAYLTFSHVINGTILGKKLLIIKSVFRFSLHLLSETLLILRRIQQDIIIHIYI